MITFLVTDVRPIVLPGSSLLRLGEFGDFPPKKSARETVAWRRACILAAFISEELYLFPAMSLGSPGKATFIESLKPTPFCHYSIGGLETIMLIPCPAPTV